ncbi:MAG: hypothetical protein ACK5LP_09190 [Campylobacteraceae bacterium]
MKNIFKLITILLLSFFIIGCSTKDTNVQNSQPNEQPYCTDGSKTLQEQYFDNDEEIKPCTKTTTQQNSNQATSSDMVFGFFGSFILRGVLAIFGF